MVKFEEPVASNDTEIFFRSARFDMKEQVFRMSVGDCFVAPINSSGNPFLLRVDALYVPIRRRLLAGAGINRMASISVYYPPIYLSDDVNLGVKLKKVNATTQRPGDVSYCIGFHRIFAPPVPHELVRHPRPLTLKLEDFIDIISSNFPKLKEIPWPDEGLAPPDAIINEDVRMSNSQSIIPIVLPVSAYNRLCKFIKGSKRHQWTPQHFLSLIGLEGTKINSCHRIFFYRKKHCLYHINKNSIRREHLAPKYKGEARSIKQTTEIQCFKALHLRQSNALPRRKLRRRLGGQVKSKAKGARNKKGLSKTQKNKAIAKTLGEMHKKRVNKKEKTPSGAKRSQAMKSGVSKRMKVEVENEMPVRAKANEELSKASCKKRRGRPPKAAQGVGLLPPVKLEAENNKHLEESLNEIFDCVLSKLEPISPACERPQSEGDEMDASEFSKCSSTSSTSSQSLNLPAADSIQVEMMRGQLSSRLSEDSKELLLEADTPGAYGSRVRDCIQPVSPPPESQHHLQLPTQAVLGAQQSLVGGASYSLPPGFPQWSMQPVTLDTPPPKEPQPLSIWVPQKTPCYNSHPLTLPQLQAMRPFQQHIQQSNTLMPIIITNAVPMSIIPQNKMSVYNVTHVNLL